jgi:hypothetical protein
VDELIVLNEVQFTGHHIGGSSTQLAESLRWIEIDIYVTVSGKYVAEVIGCSDVEGEIDFITTHDAGHPAALIELLTYKGRLSKPSQQALRAASDNDSKMADVFNAKTIRFIE